MAASRIGSVRSPRKARNASSAPGRGALERARLHESFVDVVVGRDAQADQQVAVPADELRAAVQHDCRPVFERSLEQGRGERGVDHHAGPGVE